MQILEAAGFAHAHGVIHRDFKPHNVIVDDKGHAKVTDFGIARAGASEMTETGSIMGTAQYLSPEQAQGHAVTAASDLYSIGVMLYEMLTARLPFEGESAVSIALKHLSEPPPPISQFRPDIHPALEAVVMAALAKDPARRWQSAADFAAGLIAAGEQIEAGAATGQDTAAFAPIPMPLGVEDATAATQDEPPPVLAPVTAPEEERKRRWPWFTIGLLVLALAGFLIFLAVSELTKAETREVPRVTGTQLVEAREILERAGFEVEETRVQSRLAFDQVLDQDPDPGEEAEEGSTVLLEVSGGPGTVRVPSVANLPVKQVVNRLEDRGLRADLDKRSSDSVDEGLAIRSVPGAGEVVERGETVKVFISSGPEQVEVPDVIGLSRESAEARISDAGLRARGGDRAGVGGDRGRGSRAGPGGRGRGGARRDGQPHGLHRRRDRRRSRRGRAEVPAMHPVRSAPTGWFPSSARPRSPTPRRTGVVIDQRPAAGTDVEKGREVVIIVGVLVEEDVITPGAPEAAP